MAEKPFIVGIFGPPGGGKSTLLAFFEEKGFSVWKADDAVRALYKPNAPGAKRIGEYFGKNFIATDGSVLVSRLAKLVLSKPLKLKILEYLIHPLVVNEAVHWIDEQKKLGHVQLAMEAAAFEHDGLGKYLDFLVKIDADREICKERVMARGKTEAYFKALYSVTRKYVTPHVIENSGTLEELKNKFENLYTEITMCPTPCLPYFREKYGSKI